MTNQQTIPHGLLYSIAPEHFAELHLSDDSFGDGFAWGESAFQNNGESVANDVLGFLKRFSAE